MPGQSRPSAAPDRREWAGRTAQRPESGRLAEAASRLAPPITSGPRFVTGRYSAGWSEVAKVRWNGADRTTTFINNGELHAAISLADLHDPGAASITVFNPAPGGGTSNAVVFDVAGPLENPVPTITSLAPDFATAYGAAGGAQSIRVLGLHFVSF